MVKKKICNKCFFKLCNLRDININNIIWYVEPKYGYNGIQIIIINPELINIKLDKIEDLLKLNSLINCDKLYIEDKIYNHRKHIVFKISIL